MLAVISVAFAQTQDTAGGSLREVTLGGCLASPGKAGIVIGSSAELYHAVGKNADSNRCRRLLDDLDIDLDGQALAGLTVHSGHCTRPKDLHAVLRRDDVKMMLDAVVEMGPSRSPCRGLQRFDIWVLVPKAQGYGIRIRDGRSGGGEQ